MANTTAIIRMYNGRLVDVLDLQPEDVVPKNFVHSLSCLSRYTGHTKRPYSVAEHSIKLAEWLRENGYERFMIKAALIHDWSEALFNDLASPVKKRFASYQKYEKAAQKVIFEAMQVPFEYEQMLKPYDTAIRVDEKKFFWNHTEVDLIEYQKDSAIYEGCSPEPMGVRFQEDIEWKDVRDVFSTYIKEYFQGVPGV